MAFALVSAIGYGLAAVLWLTGLLFLCTIFTKDCRGKGDRMAFAFVLCVTLMGSALAVATATAKMTGAL